MAGKVLFLLLIAPLLLPDIETAPTPCLMGCVTTARGTIKPATRARLRRDTNPHTPATWTLKALYRIIRTAQWATVFEKWVTLATVTTPLTPTLTVKVCELFPWGEMGPKGPACVKWNYGGSFYLCPSHNPGKPYCNVPGHFYCYYWGCETVVAGPDINWTPPIPDPFLRVACHPSPHPCLQLNFTILQPASGSWISGRTWGIQKYSKGIDRGIIFTVTKKLVPIPNKVGPLQSEPKKTKPRIKLAEPKLSPTFPVSPKACRIADVFRYASSLCIGKALVAITNYSGQSTDQLLEGSIPPHLSPASGTVGSAPPVLAPLIAAPLLHAMIGPRPLLLLAISMFPLSPALATTALSPRLDPYLNLLDGTFLALNNSQPNLTSSCWLCLTPSSHLSGYAQDLTPLNISTLNQDSSCNWNDATIGLTVEIEGKGLCVGNPTPADDGTYKSLCSTKMALNSFNTNSFLRPPNGTRWVCYSSGLQQCVSTAYLNTERDFCVTVVLIPKVTYHPGDEILITQEHGNHRSKRAIGIAVAAILGATGAATGLGTLIYQQVSLQPAFASMDSDIKRLEESIKFLEHSHSSLAEVVLQNRRGLDLLFFKEGGLCAALGEECCFYTNHSGVIRSNLATIRKNLEDRQKHRESKSWAALPFPSWLELSPWLTSLIVTIGGVLLIILLLLIGGPPLVTLILNLLKRQVPLLLAQTLPKELRAQPYPAMGVTQQSRALPTRAFPQV